MTDWVPGMIVLGGGVVAAGAYLLLTKRRAAAPTTDIRAKDLELRAQARIEELKELEANQHLLAPEQLVEERRRLELEAANALRERDAYLQSKKTAAPAEVTSSASASTKPPAPVASGLFARHPELRGAIWGGGLVLFFGALGLYLFLDAKDRTDGQGMTGATPMAGAQAQGGEDAEFQEALQRAHQSPNDGDLVAAVVHELLRREQYDEAQQLTERALGFDPFHMENRVHRAALEAAKGDTKKAVAELRRLADTYPDASEGLLFGAAIALDSGDKATALELFEQFVTDVPREDHPPQLGPAIAELRQELKR